MGIQKKKIEYLRFQNLDTGILRYGDEYLLFQGDSSPIQSVSTPEDHFPFLKKLARVFRYNDTLSYEEKWDMIVAMSTTLRSFFVDMEALPKEIGQLELFLNPSELGLLPFELLLDDNQKPYFVNSELILSRNNRRATDHPNLKLPGQPRVLFAYSNPEKNKTGLELDPVPHKSHLDSLTYSLRHWDRGKENLTVLENATFSDFKNALLTAKEEGKPYTHIHVLAHGEPIEDLDTFFFEYGIAFNSEKNNPEEYTPTSAKEMKEVFESLGNDTPVLACYMICDGANAANGALSHRSPVQVTFDAGVPIVLGSQFPLTMKGSEIITRELYEPLFRGDDIRNTLRTIRKKLFDIKEQENTHDWISLVNYLNLPENYGYQLLNLKTRRQLYILNQIRDSGGDSLLTEDDFIVAKYQIGLAIKDLTTSLESIELDSTRSKEFLEYAGLLGSAHKRLAEIAFKEGDILDSDTNAAQIEHLNSAKEWYYKAAQRNRSHHWSVIQYLSLKTILTGSLSEIDKDYWYAARGAAREEILRNSKATWSFGTLIELYLIKQNTSGEEHKNEILEFAKTLVKNAKPDKTEHIKSTRLQIERYLKWWNGSNFKLTNTILANDQLFIAKLVETLEV